MSVRWRIVLVAAVIASVPVSLHAEPATPETAAASDEPTDNGIQIGAGGLIGLPFGMLGDVVGAPLGGVGFEFDYRFARWPLILGFDGQIQQYSTVTATGVLRNIQPEVVVTRPESNGSLAGYIVARTQHRHGAVRPYADALIGINYTCVIKCDEGDDTPAALESRQAALGVGIGVTRRFWDTAAFDVRVRYIYSPEGVYLTRDLSVVRASTHVLQLFIGVLVF